MGEKQTPIKAVNCLLTFPEALCNIFHSVSCFGFYSLPAVLSLTLSLAQKKKRRMLRAAGYGMWTAAYACMIAHSLVYNVVPWTAVTGSWCVAWEMMFVLNYTISYFQTGLKRDLRAAIDNLMWMSADLILLCLFIQYGNGMAQDTFGWMSTATPMDRLYTLSVYVCCWLVGMSTTLFSKSMLGCIKYQSFTFGCAILCDQAHLPVMQSAIAFLFARGSVTALFTSPFVFIYGYILLSLISELCWVVVKWNTISLKPVWITRIFVVVLPLSKMAFPWTAPWIVALDRDTLMMLYGTLLVIPWITWLARVKQQ